jgi:hypothetical protein
MKNIRENELPLKKYNSFIHKVFRIFLTGSLWKLLLETDYLDDL